MDKFYPINIQEVAGKLVQLRREGKTTEAIDELYADNKL